MGPGDDRRAQARKKKPNQNKPGETHHPDELHGEGVPNKFLFDVDGVRNDFDDAFGGQLVDELLVE
jgi:hypothetical protein